MPTPAPGAHPPAVTGIARIHQPANRKAEAEAVGHDVLPAAAAVRTSTPDLNNFSVAYAT